MNYIPSLITTAALAVFFLLSDGIAKKQDVIINQAAAAITTAATPSCIVALNGSVMPANYKGGQFAFDGSVVVKRAGQ